jgi:hypothetical protein
LAPKQKDRLVWQPGDIRMVKPLTAHLPGQHDQQDHAPGGGSGSSRLDEKVAEVNALASSTGLKVGRIADLQKNIRSYVQEELGLKEPQLKAEHLEAAKGIAQGYTRLINTPGIGDALKEAAANTTVMFGHYEPAGAQMTTVTGSGVDPIILVNTAFDTATLSEGSYTDAESAYAGLRSDMELQDTDSEEAALRMAYDISIAHEFGHVMDAETGGLISMALVDAVEQHAPSSGEAFADWMIENISGYAVASSREASAEAFSRLIMNDLPPVLEDWAEEVKGAIAGTVEERSR